MENWLSGVQAVKKGLAQTNDTQIRIQIVESATDPSIFAPIRQSILLQVANIYNLEWKGILRHAWDGMFDVLKSQMV